MLIGFSGKAFSKNLHNIMAKAKILDITHPDHHKTLADIVLNGGVVGTIWGYHLYFLACNAYDNKAVARMNLIKGRPKTQVLVSPGGAEDAKEFANLKKSKALVLSAKSQGMEPVEYLNFLFKKFPLGVELFAQKNAPSSITKKTGKGKTIWFAGHEGDKTYSKLLEIARSERANGQQIIFAGSSLNLKGDNTMTVNQMDEVIKIFSDKIDLLSILPKAKTLKKVKYSTSCSAVSFIGDRPKLLRLGCTSIKTLKKYIPDLQIESGLTYTKK